MTTDTVLVVTLADGTTHSLTVSRVPANWKSVLMSKLPYGTDFQGAKFYRSDHAMRDAEQRAGMTVDEVFKRL